MLSSNATLGKKSSRKKTHSYCNQPVGEIDLAKLEA
jgi:hypothetical protein